MTPHGFVVPAFGKSPFLEACLRSLREQEEPSDILVTTSTPSAELSACAARFAAPVLVNPVRSGIGADWNFALDHAPWPVVTLAHQDDVFLPTFAKDSLAALSRQPDAGIVFTSHGEVADDGRARRRLVWLVKMLIAGLAAGRQERITGWRRRALLAFGDPIGCSAVTFNRTVLPHFRFDENLALCLDWEAWWRLHEEDVVFAHVPARLVLRRYNALSETWSGVRDGRRAREDAAMFKRIWPSPIAAFWAKLYGAGYYVQ